MTSRRQLLRASALVPVAAALAACQGQTAQQIAQAVVTNIGNVANAALSVAPKLTGAPTNVVTTITTDAGYISTLASTITTAMTQAAGQPVLSQINTYVTDLVNAAKPYVPAGSTAATILSDIQTVMPTILAAVGILLLGATQASAPDVAAAQDRLAALPRVK
jgi:hypothetical protein